MQVLIPVKYSSLMNQESHWLTSVWQKYYFMLSCHGTKIAYCHAVTDDYTTGAFTVVSAKYCSHPAVSPGLFFFLFLNGWRVREDASIWDVSLNYLCGLHTMNWGTQSINGEATILYVHFTFTVGSEVLRKTKHKTLKTKRNDFCCRVQYVYCMSSFLFRERTIDDVRGVYKCIYKCLYAVDGMYTYLCLYMLRLCMYYSF